MDPRKKAFYTVVVVATVIIFPAAILSFWTLGGSVIAPVEVSLNSGLVGYWTMNAQDTNWTSNTITDRSGNSNTGQLVAMSTTTSPTAGKIGGAMKFDGSSQYVDLGNNFVLDSATGMTKISVSAWVYRKTSSVLLDLFAREVPTNTQGYEFRLDNSTNLTQIFLGGNNSPGRYIARSTSAGVLPVNKWAHVVFVVDLNNSIAKIYINGADQTLANNDAGGAFSDDYTAATNALIGARQSGGSGFMNGSIDDVRIYNRALSATEVKQLYHIGQTTVGASPTNFLNNGLVGNWTMDASKVNWTSNTMTDSSGNGNTGQLVAMSTTTSPTAGKIGGAMKFDGSTSYVSLPNNSSLNITGSITMSAWIKTTSTGVTAVIGGYDGTGPVLFPGYGFALGTPTTGKMAYWSGAQATWLAANSTVNDGKWHHVVITVTGTTGTFYRDGVADGVISTNVPNSYSGVRAIGSLSNGLAVFPGSLDDVRIYNRALSATEINQLYHSGQTTVGVSNPNFLNNGLVGNWTMDNQDINFSTMRITDRSVSGNTGQLVAMSTTTSGTAGKTGSALKFNGSSQYVSIPSQQMFNDLVFAGQSITLAAWIKPTSLSSYYSILHKESTGVPTGQSAFLFFRWNGGILFQISNGGASGAENYISAESLVAGQWNHVAITHTYGSGASTRAYINGKLVSGSWAVDGNRSHNPTTAYPVVIGATDDGTTKGGYFNGSIDDVRIYNRTLSATEVQQLYNAGL